MSDVFDNKIEKEQNVDKTKQYSFFVKDTAEFEMFEEFETITGLTAKEVISEYKKLREDGFAAGIGINIPSDTTFDNPKGLGTTILIRENGVDTFDIYGDSFIVDLKENNEKTQNRIAAYKIASPSENRWSCTFSLTFTTHKRNKARNPIIPQFP